MKNGILDEVTVKLNPHLNFFAEYKILPNSTQAVVKDGFLKEIKLNEQGSLVLTEDSENIKIYEAL